MDPLFFTDASFTMLAYRKKSFWFGHHKEKASSLALVLGAWMDSAEEDPLPQYIGAHCK